MKILIRGNKPVEKFVGKCTKCDSVIEAEASELLISPGDYRSDFEDFAWSQCPACLDNSVCFHREGSKSAKRIK